jgi:hypothetical protein
MKSMRTASIPILVCALLFVAPAVPAFYNPQTGRWLNRDPVEERGGRNLTEFVANNPVQHSDMLGMFVSGNPDDAWSIFQAVCPLCEGKRYSAFTHCCCLGRIVSRRKIPSGVVTHSWRENSSGGGGRVHVWITWLGGSADSNSDEMLRAGGPGDRKVRVPAGFTMPATSPGYSSEALELSPCKYDFSKLNACLSREANALQGQSFGLCWSLPSHLIGKCMAESKGCTVP